MQTKNSCNYWGETGGKAHAVGIAARVCRGTIWQAALQPSRPRSTPFLACILGLRASLPLILARGLVEHIFLAVDRQNPVLESALPIC